MCVRIVRFVVCTFKYSVLELGYMFHSVCVPFKVFGGEVWYG